MFGRILRPLFLFLLFITSIAKAQIITTIAGNGIKGYNGDARLAVTAELSGPSGVFTDEEGNIYFTDMSNNRLRSINTAGFISTFAGNGIPGYNGDNIEADAATLNRPNGICMDNEGNVFIADWYNNRVRKIDHITGKITTVAGNGMYGYNGEEILATSAKLAAPSDVVVDDDGNIFIADHDNNRIRKITKATGKITTYAGTGTASYSGDGGPAKSASVYQPTGLSMDDQGSLIIVDHGNAVIRKVDAAGIITTIAGNNITGFGGDGLSALEASFDHPTGACYDAEGNLYIADQGNNRVRKVDAGTGIISTFAGNGVDGFNGDGGAPTDAELSSPWDIAFDTSGVMYITDLKNDRIRMITPAEVEEPEEQELEEVQVVKDPLVLDIYDLNSDQVSIYPNPASDKFSLSLSDMQDLSNYKLAVYNSNGNIMALQSIDISRIDVDISFWAAGSYIVAILHNDIPVYSTSLLKIN